MTPEENFERMVERFAQHRTKKVYELHPARSEPLETYVKRCWRQYADFAREDLLAIGLGPQSWIAPWEASQAMFDGTKYNWPDDLGRDWSAMRDAHLARREP